ncbi:MAG: dTDP-4-dehydrorhamnose 3,5-epimerase [Flavobacteriales bacterium]|nr:dTDP-4-dehydrorhamnose 3,5-epimerase [Flavobacteriales bacterium]
MKLIKTEFEGLFLIKPNVFGDARGYFYEGFNKKTLQSQGLDIEIVQTNISESQKGVVRGLHFQNPPFEQGKLIRVLKGSVLDVVVDIRTGSPTFGKYYSVELSEENKRALWVPAGFAHGFKTLEDQTLFYYNCSQVYNKESEGSIRWNDPQLEIDWGIENPIISEKDEIAPLFKEFESQFSIV